MGSDWEAECLKEGTLRFGYHETTSEALRGDWRAVWDSWYKFRKDQGAATRFVTAKICALRRYVVQGEGS